MRIRPRLNKIHIAGWVLEAKAPPPFDFPLTAPVIAELENVFTTFLLPKNRLKREATCLYAAVRLNALAEEAQDKSTLTTDFLKRLEQLFTENVAFEPADETDERIPVERWGAPRNPVNF